MLDKGIKINWISNNFPLKKYSIFSIIYTICITYSNIQYCYRIPINFEHLPTCIWLRIRQGIMWYILYLYLHVHVLFISLNNRLISIILIPYPLPTHHQSHNTLNIKQGESESQMCSLSLISFGEIIIYILPTFSHLYQANILFIHAVKFLRKLWNMFILQKLTNQISS